jgi:hypothetical protein
MTFDPSHALAKVILIRTKRAWCEAECRITVLANGHRSIVRHGILQNSAKQGLRRLRHSPMFAAITLVTLGIGIGANSAIFSVVNAVLPASYPHPDSLVRSGDGTGSGFRA